DGESAANLLGLRSRMACIGTINEQSQVTVADPHGEVMPFARGQRSGAGDCDGLAAAVVACERSRAIDTEHQLVPLIRQLRHVGLRLCGLEANPSRYGQTLAGSEMDRAVGRDGNRLGAGELRTRPDQGGRTHLRIERGGITLISSR